MEQMNYNLLFRWFVGLGIDDRVWVPTVFSKNRDRLLTTEMSRKVMAAILSHPEVKPLLSDEHFSVDGTLIKAWASMKSFQPKDSTPPPYDDDPGAPPLPSAEETSPDSIQPQQTETPPMPYTPRQTRNAEVNFRGEKRSNATHASVTDPDARLYRKAPGAAAMLCFMGHTLMEDRNGLIVQVELNHADSYGERKAALEMLNRHSPGSTRRLTLGAGTLRLGQDGGRHGADAPPWPRQDSRHIHDDHGGLQPGQAAETSCRLTNGATRKTGLAASEPRLQIAPAGTASLKPDFFSSLLS